MAAAAAFGSRGAAVAANPVTVTGLTFNAAAADRLIVAHIVSTDADGYPLVSVTIGGVSATQLKAAKNSNTGSELWQAAVPTGTSGNVVVTATAALSVSVATFSLTGANPTPTDTDSANGNGADISITGLTIPSGGVGIAGVANAGGGGAITWTGGAEQYDASAGFSRHSGVLVTTEGTNTITADGDTQPQALVGVAWGPAAATVTTQVDLDPASFAYTPGSLGVVTKRLADLDPVSLAYTPSSLSVSTKRVVTLSPASFAYTPSDLGINRVLMVTSSINLPTGGRITRRKRKTLPYGWWAEVERPAEEIVEAEQAIAEARREVAEVATSGDVGSATARHLDAALWFADVETKLDALEAAASKHKRQAELSAIAAQVAKAKAEYERALEEQDEEEAIALLFADRI